ncbi:MAG TPA: choline dehydrogenase [Chloroflexia bacterium]|nr:choline dehydrogenase [Chloroflexia bacterium]
MADYIIVGAGSAGCVLANRLTENPDVSVLLLEAGPPDDMQEIQIPLAFPQLFKTPFDWAYFTEEEPYLEGRKLYWPRGRVLGGSSSLNAMIYIRGNRGDYDLWSNLGNEGWDYESVLPYFKKAENQELGPSEYHGVGGPLNVANLRSPNPMSQAFVEAATELGFNPNPDFNGPQQEGWGLYQVTQKQGMRFSAATAYLKPASERPNLSVETGALTTRVLFEGQKAVGVEYLQNGEVKQARAAREVILSGGAVNSPQVLMLSGVGPADHLREMGIEVVADMPGVGQNLQDHPAIFVPFEATQPVSLVNGQTEAALQEFMATQTGPLTSNVGEAGCFLRTRDELPVPDLQFHFAPNYFVEHGFRNPEGHGFTFGPTLLHPESRGEVRLRSADPTAPAAITANYLAAENDMRVLIEGIKLARKLAQAKAFDPYRGKEVMPGEAVQSDEEIADYIRKNVETLYHPVGTCKMGHDDMAVVDNQLRVHGLEGLRVVDASIMPVIVSGNTNAPTIMIAEKAADMIKSASPAGIAAQPAQS